MIPISTGPPLVCRCLRCDTVIGALVVAGVLSSARALCWICANIKAQS